MFLKKKQIKMTITIHTIVIIKFLLHSDNHAVLQSQLLNINVIIAPRSNKTTEKTRKPIDQERNFSSFIFIPSLFYLLYNRYNAINKLYKLFQILSDLCLLHS